MAEVYLQIKDYPLLDEGHYHELAWEEESSEEISSPEDSEEEDDR